MIWHLIAAVFAGLASAGIGLLLRTLSGKRIPRWIVPVFAALGMLAYQIHHEYSWLSYKQEQLPESTQIISSEEGEMFWRPWTYFFPMTMAFEVVDQDNLVTRQMNDQQVVEFIVYRFERHYMDLVTHQTYLMNCSTQEVVPLDGQQRQPRFSDLRSVSTSDPLYQGVCTDH